MNSKWGVRNAIISGAASGIGLAIAKTLASDGANIVMLDLKIPQEAQDQILLARASGEQRLLACEVDITDAPGVRTAVNTSVAELGAPDFALNCAGIQAAGNFEQLDDEQYARVINVNLLGSRNFAVSVLPHMQDGARLALVASLGGLVANYAYSAYSASKFGVVGLADVLRTEYAPLGIGISVICPPEVMTPMVEQELANMHPVQAALKGGAGRLELEQLVPDVMEQTLLKKRYRVIPGGRAKLMYYLARFLPTGLFHAYIDRVVNKTLTTHPEAPRR